MTSKLLVRMLTLLCAGLAFAGNSTVTTLSGPRLGLIFDRAAGDLRAVTGIPGAAITSDPLSLGFLITQAAISPAQDSALVVKVRGSSLMLVRPNGDGWAAATLEGVRSAPDSLVYSQGGRSAALYYRAGRVQILTGLPSAPVIAGEIDLSGLPTPLTALAVDDSGSFVLMALGQVGAVSLFRASVGSAPSLLGSFPSVSSVRVFDAGRRALVADSLAATVYEISDPAGAAAKQVIASAADGIEGLVDADTDSAGMRVFAALANGTVLIFDRSGGPAEAIDCGCKPAGLFRLAGAAAFRLTEPGTGPFQVLDASNTLRMVAVPPPAHAAALPEGRR